MRCFMVIAVIVERIKDPRNTQSLILLSDAEGHAYLFECLRQKIQI